MKFNTIYLIICTWGGLYALPGAAQRHHQLQMGAGIGSSPHFVTSDNGWKEKVDGKGTTTVNSSGVYHLGYQYTGAGRHSFGIMLAGERQKVIKGGAPVPDLSEFYRERYKEVEDRYLSALADYRFAWRLRPAAKWYSGFSPGISWQQRKEKHNDFSHVKDEFNKARFAYQVTAVGFSFGREIGGYAELGYGYKGIFSVGVKYDF